MSSLLWYMSSCARVIQEGRGHFLIGRHALFWSDIIKRWKGGVKAACAVMDGDGGSIENLVRRIIRSVQEPSADRQQNRRVQWPTTVTAKANRSRQKQIHSRQKQINSMRYFHPGEYTNLAWSLFIFIAYFTVCRRISGFGTSSLTFSITSTETERSL